MTKFQLVRTIILLLILFLLIFSWLFLPDYFYQQGLAYYKQGDYQNAYKSFLNARVLDKQNSDCRYYYAQTLAKFKPTLKIQKEMFDFANDTKDDSAHLFAGIQVNIWKNNAMQIYGANYIEQAPTDSKIIRWNPKTFPLKVYISFPANSSYPDYYKEQVTKAFTQWVKSSGFISFKFVNSYEKADIVVKFEKLPKNGCSKDGCNMLLLILFQR